MAQGSNWFVSRFGGVRDSVAVIVPVGAIGLAAGLAEVTLHSDSMAWGTVPDWLAAIGTTFAAGFGVRAYVSQSKYREMRDEQERRAQAQRLWLTPPICDRTSTDEDGVTAWLGMSTIIHNASDLPIEHAVVRLTPAWKRESPHAGEYHAEPITLTVGRLGPGAEPKVGGNTQIRQASLIEQNKGLGNWEVTVRARFTDAASRHWARDHAGRLLEASARNIWG